MAKNTCRLCSRRFASPRALAGHMRAHSIAAAKSSQISSASSASTSVVPGGDDAKKPAQGYVLREKPRRRVRLAESDFSDRESETTGFSPSSPSAKHGGHAGAGSGDAEPVSSVSDGVTPEEDVAMSLVILSRDSWPSPPPPASPCSVIDSDDDESDARPPIAQKRTRYECPACKKVFRSYQALGGHRASNVRGRKGGCCALPPLHTPPPSPMKQPLPAAGEGATWKPQPHQCPHCSRVFSSGHALGSHRRSRLCSAPAAADAPTAVPPAPMKSLGFIDLNLPPTLDDVELSTVSDPFLSSKPAAS
jgi:hypothetical protein